MKIVYNENDEGFFEEDSISVKTINGKHYYLTQTDLTEIEERRLRWEAKALERALEACDTARRFAYQTEADPLFFKAQRQEIPLQDWLDKIEEIKIRIPKPE